MLGGEIVNQLVYNFGVTKMNARKILQRAVEAGLFKSSAPLTFGKGQFLYYSFSNKLTLEKIIEASENTRPPLYRLLRLLIINGGISSYFEALKITASPSVKNSSKINHVKEIISPLVDLGFLIEKMDEIGNLYILLKINSNGGDDENLYMQLIKKHYNDIRIDALFVADISRWIFDLGLSNFRGFYRSTSKPTFGVEHNNLFWDAYSYSNIRGFTGDFNNQPENNEKQTFIPIDVVISREYSKIDLDAFLSRINVHINSTKTNKRKALAVIVFVKISKHAYSAARKLGFLTISLEKIYGNNILKLIDSISNSTIDIEEKQSERISKALNEINNNGLNDQLKAVRGALFEALMNIVLSKIYSSSIIIPGYILKDSKITREYDLLIDSIRPEEILLVELKGYAGNSYINLGDSQKKGTLKYFFKSSVPLAQREYVSNRFLDNSNIKALFITTGDYHSESKDFINQMNKSKFKPSKLPSTILNGNELIDFLIKEGFKHEAKVIKKFYVDFKAEN